MDKTTELHTKLNQIKNKFAGDIFTDEISRILYATDASAYREKPTAVVRPKNKTDLQTIIEFANTNKTSLIPRAAGTSLAGQVVGNGIVVDISKYLNKIIELNAEEQWVRVEPGVNLEELNRFLAHHGLLFGPETSTANRCLIGGMLGNNACGLHSLVYGSTRDHTIAVKTLLSDGSEVEFKSITNNEFEKKCEGDTLENKIYRNIRKILSDKDNAEEIRNQYPDISVPRRNTGYAIDLLLESAPFTENKPLFNFSKLLAGSEGTLAFTTEIKLHLHLLPPKEKAVVAVHCKTLEDALYGNLVALQHKPTAVELMDDIIMNCTKDNIEQQKNRFFIKENPAALLIVEFVAETKQEIEKKAANLEKAMRDAGYGYHFPVIFGDKTKNVWNLRKAGLGVLGNIPGDAKPVSVIEDTAIRVDRLPDYIAEFKQLLAKYKLTSVFHAHIATGELHLRPLLNLKDKKDVTLFHTVAYEIARLVKKYKGSLSGEHGDGRLRGEFIPLIIGEKNYELLKQIKQTWDPNCIFNPGKIVDTPSMNTNLRYEPGRETRKFDTIFDFSKAKGMMRAIEKCNGSGDCRKSEIIGGTMCPSFMASRDEKNLTRARANILREFLTNSDKTNPFDHKEIYEVLDLCLSCKACKSECPSSVDIAKLKAEFLQHYYDANGIPMRSRLIAYISRINRFGAITPGITNFFMKNKTTSGILKKMIGFAPQREMPPLHKTTLQRWTAKNEQRNAENHYPNGTVYLFNDEITNFNDTDIGIKAIRLLTKLGYKVVIPKHTDSGRTFFSKGLLRTAQKIAIQNVKLLKDKVSEQSPLIGIEPSAILSFRDEYPEICGKSLEEDAKKLAKHALLIDEFLCRELDAGKIDSAKFTEAGKEVLLHGHCQQKAVASTEFTIKMLSLPKNYHVEEIPSGCCGMAGSFGYEREHYDLSMKVGELVLFPAVRKASKDTIIAAPGTSCRQQIKDGTNRTAYHPVEILFDALI